MEQITSRENPRVKRVLKLLSDRREREAAGLFVAEGLRLCVDASISGLCAKEVFVTAKALERYPELRTLAGEAGEAYLIPEGVAEKLSETKTPQGVVAVFEKIPAGRPDNHAIEARYLLLSSLQDPGNVGAIMRAAEAFGIDGVALSSDCPDLYAPKTLRAAMGGVFRLKTWTTPDMLEEIELLKAGGVTVYAAALGAGAESLKEIRFAGVGAVLLGNEGAGLPETLVNACDHAVTIPMIGSADSLGVAAAAAIFAWEMKR